MCWRDRDAVAFILSLSSTVITHAHVQPETLDEYPWLFTAHSHVYKTTIKPTCDQHRQPQYINNIPSPLDSCYTKPLQKSTFVASCAPGSLVRFIPPTLFPVRRTLTLTLHHIKANKQVCRNRVARNNVPYWSSVSVRCVPTLIISGNVVVNAASHGTRICLCCQKNSKQISHWSTKQMFPMKCEMSLHVQRIFCLTSSFF